MAVTNFSPFLGLALPTTGDLSGTWGATVNTSITDLIDSAIAGTTTITTDLNYPLSTTNGASNEAREAIILCTGARTSIKTITAPAQSKTYIVINATTGGFAVQFVGSGPTTGVTVPNGYKVLIAWNGSDFVKVASSVINLASDVTGTLPVANGGTGQTTFTDGQLLIGNTTGNTLTKATLTAGAGVTITNGSGAITIAATAAGSTVTSVTGSGNIASSGGTTPNITFTGTLPVANGGTGAATLTANNVLLGNGTSALQVVAPGTTGNVLTSNGTTWSSSAQTTTSFVFLAAVTPTAAANVDFLNTFSANYDSYLILGTGINFAATDSLSIRLAAAGTADSGSNYVNVNGGPDINISSTSTSVLVSNSVLSTGKGCNFEILVSNANDAANFKAVNTASISNDVATTSYIYKQKLNAYFATNAVTGFRLFATGASNFAAVGTVRVYGYKNS
jgi:hypothetical protein